MHLRERESFAALTAHPGHHGSPSVHRRYRRRPIARGVWKFGAVFSPKLTDSLRPPTQALEAAEEKLDEKIEKMDRLEEDDSECGVKSRGRSRRGSATPTTTTTPPPVERLRRERVEQLKRSQKQRQQWVAQGHGDYMEIADEKQFFAELKKEARAVVHFYRAATRRCEIVDAHLSTLARKHVETRFIKVSEGCAAPCACGSTPKDAARPMQVNAEKSPFICERLKIMVLPTITLIKEGRTDHSIIGFDELGGHDSFSTEDLERLLLRHEVVLEQFCS